jgi:transcription-repair coupling factor (superfamily II helicase)
VGRSSRRAYAYFTYPKDKTVSEIATKRLEAIRDYAEFGAGFKIAIRDLEIRGAGNLLGAEQHGHLDAVGYELYIKLLNEAVLEERGERSEKKVETVVDMQLNAHIPDYYIKSSAERMEMYKKISLISSVEDERDVADEFLDRFGDMPKSVQRLLSVALLKALSEKIGISRVEANAGTLSFITGKPDLALWSEVFASFPGMRFGPGGDRVIYRVKGEPQETGAAILVEYCKAMEGVAKKKTERLEI